MARDDFNLDRPSRWQTGGSPACLCQVPMDSEEFRALEKYFREDGCMPAESVNIVKIERFEDEAFFRPYAVYTKLMLSEAREADRSGQRFQSFEQHDFELWLWHMCDDYVENILNDGFVQNRTDLLGNVYGRGVYFARDPRLAHRSIMARTSVGRRLRPGEDYQIILAQVVVGKCAEVTKYSRLKHPFKDEDNVAPRGFHSVTGKDYPGREVVVFPGPFGVSPAYPAYVVSYRFDFNRKTPDLAVDQPLCVNFNERLRSQVFRAYHLYQSEPQVSGFTIDLGETKVDHLRRKAKDVLRAKKLAKAFQTDAICAECGTVHDLEEDVNDPGLYYCQRCWETYEDDVSDYSEDMFGNRLVDLTEKYRHQEGDVSSETPPSSEQSQHDVGPEEFFSPEIPETAPPPEPESPDVRDGLSDIDDRENLFDSDGLDGPDDLGLDRHPFGEWSPLEALPVARSHLAAATCNDVVYAIGGRSGCGTSLTHVDCFDRWTHRWKAGSPLSVGRHGLAAAATKDAVYVVGGRGSAGNIIPNMERLDPRMASWAILSPLPTARESLAMIAIGNELFALGGRNNRGNPVRTVDKFDVRTGSWADVAPLRFAREGLAAGTLNGKLYALGGRLSDNTCTATMERFNLKDGIWSEMAPMPTPRDNFAVAALHGRLYSIGGRDHRAASLTTVERFKPWTGGWGSVHPLPLPRDGLAAVTFRGALVALGGRMSSGIRGGLGAAAQDGALFEISAVGTRMKHGTPAVDTVVRLKLRRGLTDLNVWQDLCMRREEVARRKREWIEELQAREIQILQDHAAEQREKLKQLERKLRHGDLHAQAILARKEREFLLSQKGGGDSVAPTDLSTEFDTVPVSVSPRAGSPRAAPKAAAARAAQRQQPVSRSRTRNALNILGNLTGWRRRTPPPAGKSRQHRSPRKDLVDASAHDPVDG